MTVKRVWVAFAVFLSILLIGTLIYHEIEGWGYLDCLYFTTITVTTVGYGDFAPKTDNGKIFTILFAISGIGLALYILTVFARYMINIRRRVERKGGYIKLKRRR